MWRACEVTQSVLVRLLATGCSQWPELTGPFLLSLIAAKRSGRPLNGDVKAPAGLMGGWQDPGSWAIAVSLRGWLKEGQDGMIHLDLCGPSYPLRFHSLFYPHKQICPAEFNNAAKYVKEGALLEVCLFKGWCVGRD